MISINNELKPAHFNTKLARFWELSGQKIELVEKTRHTIKGSPVFTRNGIYTTRGWTEWTQGFQYGSALLQFDATGEKAFLEMGRDKILRCMAQHISHTGVHDHGFNNISTYGNLLRLMHEGKTDFNEWEKNFFQLALKISGAVQANRWTTIKTGGYIYSFNGPHSLFVDTIRSVRSLVLAYCLNHVMQGEGDEIISLLERAIRHLKSTAQYSVYYGENRDIYDVRGRTAHESIFNTKDGNYRCPNSQQGYSGFSTWTRGLAWAICGFAEELEWFDTTGEKEFKSVSEKSSFLEILLKASRATCDFYIQHTPLDGVPYWDTGAPGLEKMDNYLERSADPFNLFEPVDSSAAVIAAQGLMRLGRFLRQKGEEKDGNRYWQAGLTVMYTILDEPYLSTDPAHQGLILHSVYHRPNGWDHIREGASIPYGESSMWGDYHAREAALYLQRILKNETYYCFYNIQ